MQYGHGQQGNNQAGNPPARQSLHQNSGPQPYLPQANIQANSHTNRQVNSQTQYGASAQRQQPNPQTRQNTRNQTAFQDLNPCLLYTSPSPRDKRQPRMPSSA